VGEYLASGLPNDLQDYFISPEYTNKPYEVKLQECREALKDGLELLIDPNEEEYIDSNNNIMKLIYKEALRLSHEKKEAQEYKPELAVELDGLLFEASKDNGKSLASGAISHTQFARLEQWNPRNIKPNIPNNPLVLKDEFRKEYKPVLHAAPTVVVHAAPQQQAQVAPPQQQAQVAPPQQQVVQQAQAAPPQQQPVQPPQPQQPQPNPQPQQPQPQVQQVAPASFRDPKAIEEMESRILNRIGRENKTEYNAMRTAFSRIKVSIFFPQSEIYGKEKEAYKALLDSGVKDEEAREYMLKLAEGNLGLEIKIRRELLNETPKQITDLVYSKLSGCIRAGRTEEFRELFNQCPTELKLKLLENQRDRSLGAENLLYEAMMSGNQTIFEILKNEKPDIAKSLIFDHVLNGKKGGEPFVDGQNPPEAKGAALAFFKNEITELIQSLDAKGINDNRLLNIAAYFGATEAVQIALEKGADPSLKGSRSSNALNIAANMATTPKDLSFKRESYLHIVTKCFDLIENGAIEDRAKYRNAVADSGALRYLYDDGSLEDFAEFLDKAKSCNVPLTVRQPVADPRTGNVLEPRDGKLLEGVLLEQEIIAWLSPFQMAGKDPEKNKLALEKFKLLVDAGIIDMRAIDRLQEEEKARVKSTIDFDISNNPDAAKAWDYAGAVNKINTEAALGEVEDKRNSGLKSLRTKLVAEPEKQLAETQEKWLATLKTPEPTAGMTPQVAEELNRNKLKSESLKRMMLFYGCSGLSVTGNTSDEYGNPVHSTKPAQENNLPVAAYVSGQMGRCHVDVPNGFGDRALNYIATGNPDTPEGHGLFTGFVRKTRSLFQPARETRIVGVNIAAGGLGQPHQSTTAAIKGDGQDGRMQFKVEDDFIEARLKGTAQGTASSLGTDEFTAFEGAKYAIAVKKSSRGELKQLLEEVIKTKLSDDPTLKAAFKANLENLTGLKISDSGEIRNPRVLGNKTKVKGICGILELKTFDDGKTLNVVTPFGKSLMDQGIVLQTSRGAVGSYSETNFNSLVKTKNIPDEIVYFKPRADLTEFMAQEAIYKNIDEKPLLKAHPEFSYETSNMIGRLYNALPDPQAKATLALLEEYMKDPNFSRQVLHNIAVENTSISDVNLAFKAVAAEKRSAIRIAKDKAEADREAAARAAAASPLAVIAPAVPLAVPTPVIAPVVPVAVPTPAILATRSTMTPPPPVKMPPASRATPATPPASPAKSTMSPPPVKMPPASRAIPVTPPAPPAKSTMPPPPPAAAKPAVAANKPEPEIKSKSRIDKMFNVAKIMGAIGIVCLAASLFVPGAQVALPILLGLAAIGIGGGAVTGLVAGVLKLGDMAFEGIKKAFSSPVKPEPVVATPPMAPQKTPPPPPLPTLSPSATPSKTPPPSSQRTR